MGPDTIASLHRGSKIAIMLWLPMRRAGLPSSWFLMVAFGMFMAVRALLLPWLYGLGYARPW